MAEMLVAEFDRDESLTEAIPRGLREDVREAIQGGLVTCPNCARCRARLKSRMT